jgi:ATP-dependent exoDNAse (exonuclease V) alpha subunit
VKGIEFDKVFVIPNGMSRNEKYIAYTRALTELTIVIDEELEKRIEKRNKMDSFSSNESLK